MSTFRKVIAGFLKLASNNQPPPLLERPPELPHPPLLSAGKAPMHPFDYLKDSPSMMIKQLKGMTPRGAQPVIGAPGAATAGGLQHNASPWIPMLGNMAMGLMGIPRLNPSTLYAGKPVFSSGFNSHLSAPMQEASAQSAQARAGNAFIQGPGGLAGVGQAAMPMLYSQMGVTPNVPTGMLPYLPGLGQDYSMMSNGQWPVTGN